MAVRQIQLLGNTVSAQYFINFGEYPSLETTAGLVECFFPVSKETWQTDRKINV
jgi:hypothetical protein